MRVCTPEGFIEPLKCMLRLIGAQDHGWSRSGTLRVYSTNVREPLGLWRPTPKGGLFAPAPSRTLLRVLGHLLVASGRTYMMDGNGYSTVPSSSTASRTFASPPGGSST